MIHRRAAGRRYVSEPHTTRIRASGFASVCLGGPVVSGFIPLIFGNLLWPALRRCW